MECLTRRALASGLTNITLHERQAGMPLDKWESDRAIGAASKAVATLNAIAENARELDVNIRDASIRLNFWRGSASLSVKLD